MTVELTCPYCADPTSVDPDDPRCHSCHARIDLAAIGRSYVPWTTRVAYLVAALLAISALAAGAAWALGFEVTEADVERLVHGDCSDLPTPVRGPGVCEDRDFRYRCVKGIYRIECPPLPASVRPQPTAATTDRPGQIWGRACANSMDCRRACPPTLRRGVGGLEKADTCARAFADGCFGAERDAQSCGDWGRRGMPPAPASRVSSPRPRRPGVFGVPRERPAKPASPAQPAPAVPVCDPLCQRMCGQFDDVDFAACARAYEGGCFTDPQAPDAVCGGFRGNFLR